MHNPEISWKNVILFIAVAYLFIHLPLIIDTVGGIFADSLTAIDHSIKRSFKTGYHRNSDIYALVRLCIFLIFIVGVMKLFKKGD
ncbi:hypothetical protein ACFL6B_05275 [Thermodesulfobacteriota bacterium]